ncbi:MAG TPA: PAS domain S-box protein [Caulobacter sp.]|nr:PAS domain S-box protein [Caulobacter sp.]
MPEEPRSVGGMPGSGLAWKDMTRTAALAAAGAGWSYALTVLMLLIPRDFGAIEPVWVVNAVTLAVLLSVDSRRWPALLVCAALGSMLGGLTVREGLWAALALAACNLLEIATCAVILRRWCGRQVDFSRWTHLRVLLLVAPVAAMAAAALASLALDLLGSSSFLINFTVWASADTLGLLIVTPSLLALGAARADLVERPFTVRSALILAGFIGVIALVLTHDRYPLLFLIPPAVIVVASELERPGTALALLLLGVASVVMIMAGAGPLQLVSASQTERIVVLQALLAVCTLLGLIVAAQSMQRRRLQASLVSALEEVREQARWASMAERIAGVGYWRMEVATNRISWSDQMFRIYGLKIGPEPALEAAMAAIHPDDQAETDGRLARILATGEGWSNDVSRVVRPNGEVRYMTGAGVAERGPDGKVAVLFGTLMDITDRKLAELALAQSEAHYRQLADNTADTIACFGRDDRIRYLSPSVERLTGYTVAQLTGADAAAYVHPDDIDAIRAAHRELFAGLHPDGVTLEYRVRHKAGHWLWVESRRTLTRGEAPEIVGVQRDVTARKAMEAELVEARAAAEAAASAKADFLANMSHELRTPLTSILGFTRLAAEQPGLDPLTRGYVERVTEGGQALLSVVNDILDFSKLEAGQLVIRPQPTAPARLARAALELFGPQAGAKDLTLTLDSDITEDQYVLADPDRLRQILLNLVGNAVKFTEAGTVTLSLRREGERLSASVRDTGPGIAADRLHLLFRRFSQVDGSAGGTGLGLAICKGLVEAMGGEIAIESQVGEGSCFSFSFPAPAAEPPAPVEAAIARAAASPGLRILVADDHPANRELVQLVLRGIGAEVTVAEDGAEAVERADKDPYDVILLDLRMPRMAGDEALRLIREPGRLNETTPILAFTADAGPESAGRLTSIGFDGVVSKPVEPATLIPAVLQAAAVDTDELDETVDAV